MSVFLRKKDKITANTYGRKVLATARSFYELRQSAQADRRESRSINESTDYKSILLFRQRLRSVAPSGLGPAETPQRSDLRETSIAAKQKSASPKKDSPLNEESLLLSFNPTDSTVQLLNLGNGSVILDKVEEGVCVNILIGSGLTG